MPEISSSVIAVIIGSLFGIYISGYLFWLIIEPSVSSAIRGYEEYKISKMDGIPRELKEKYDSLLNNKINYYKNLPEKSKIKFLQRLDKFIVAKNFSGRVGLVVTDEMKTLISAAAIQLTFGLNKYKLDYFHEIFIYPDVYESPIDREYHRGETQASGIIMVSWNYFLEGYAINDDRINLGLHEMAHALDLSRTFDETDNSFLYFFNKWKIAAADEIDNVNSEKQPFLRKYGGTNQGEFFAVCVEHFFECPDLFYIELPELYKHLCNLLKQNPIGKTNPEAWNTSNQPIEEITREPSFTAKPIINFHIGIMIGVVCFMIYFYLLKIPLCILDFFIGYIGILYLIVIIKSFNQIEIVGDFISVKNIFYKNSNRHYFALENIISVYFYDVNGGSVTITYLQDGNVKTKSRNMRLQGKDKEFLKTFLRERSIMTR